MRMFTRNQVNCFQAHEVKRAVRSEDFHLPVSKRVRNWATANAAVKKLVRTQAGMRYWLSIAAVFQKHSRHLKFTSKTNPIIPSAAW
jgi:hypothetical protein